MRGCRREAFRTCARTGFLRSSDLAASLSEPDRHFSNPPISRLNRIVHAAYMAKAAKPHTRLQKKFGALIKSILCLTERTVHIKPISMLSIDLTRQGRSG